MEQWYSGTVAQLHRCSVELWLSAKEEQWHSGTGEQWQSGTPEQWYSEIVAQLHCGSVEPWHNGTVAHWNRRTLEQWNSDTVEHWNSGTVKQWRSRRKWWSCQRSEVAHGLRQFLCWATFSTFVPPGAFVWRTITHTGEDEPGGCSLPPKTGCRRHCTSAFTVDYPRWRIVGYFTLTLRSRAINSDICFVTSVISVWLHIYIDYTLKDIYLLQRRMGGVCRELMLCSLGLALIRISFRVRETLKNKYRMTLVRK